jgi:ABC-type glycerol-3-phosphate transport system permease component
MTTRACQPEKILPRSIQLAGVTLLSLVAILPICCMLLVSVTPDNESVSGRLWPSRLAFGNYVQLWSSVPLAQGLTNSIMVSLSAAVASTLLAVGSAYCLVRFTFVGRAVILRSLVGLQALPGTMLILPLFVVFSSIQAYLGMQIVGTRAGLIVTY